MDDESDDKNHNFSEAPQILEMIFFDNIVYSLQKSGGISRFWSKITEPYLLSDQFIEREDATQNIYRHEQHLMYRLPDHRLPKSLARYLNFRLSLRDERHVFHSSYFRINRSPSAINVTTVHDLIYERFVSGLASRIHIAQKRRSLEMADCIVCVSEHTRKDLLEYYPLTRDKRVLVIPNGVDALPAELTNQSVSMTVRQAAEGGDFFLYVGHRGSCKGFDHVYQALRLCGPSWRCIIVGGALVQQERADIAAAGLKNRVVPVGRVTDAELAFLYSQAGFFFFPSLYEGFGIPPLEAMKQGCPVLASNRSSIPEVVGDAGVLFDPDDVSSLENGLSEILLPSARNSLIAKGRQRADIFSWNSAIDQYRTLYTELLNGR
jgi:glycosyltransferase involved in cell wall biosynthesis